MYKRQILFTRPLEDCEGLILKFSELGHKVSHMPVIQIEKIKHEIINLIEWFNRLSLAIWRHKYILICYEVFSHFYLHGIFDCTTTYFGRYEILFSITRNVILHLRIACITASWQNFISWFLQIMISSVNADFQCDEFSNGESAMVNKGDCGHSYLALLRLKKIFGEKIFFPIESISADCGVRYLKFSQG